MNQLKNTNTLTVAQRKGLAVIMLAIALTNSHITTHAFAAGPVLPETQTQTQAVEPETPAIQPTVQEVLLSVCKENGYGEDCAKTLLGMLWNESSNRSTVIGDNGAARGYFQIHYKLHKISIACAEDLVCSANWSINYLERNSYPKYVSYAVQCHNSCNVNNGYAAKAFRNAKLMWNQPLAVTQAAPIVLAMK
ncbi:hypothetical protein K8R04_00520 [Candidatus Uhrbacteria bacterium]|nr:hypothetical protein [Candidatus Uhrbacteria bacterium]